MSADGWIVLAILAAAIIGFASNRVRVDGVAMGVLLALAITGSVTAEQALAGFSDPAVLMIGGLFVVGEGLVATGVAAALGNQLAIVGRGGETRLIVLLMVVVATFGAFMSSTGVVAIFIPVVLGLASQGGFSRSRLMMPLSVGALISGLMTLIATAPNLVVSAALVERGLEPLGFFELTPIGITVLLLAIVYMVTIGRRLLDRPEPPTQRESISADELIASYGLRGRFRALRVGPGSPLIGQTIADAAVRTRYAVTLVAIGRQQRGSFGVMPALAESVLLRGDLLFVLADAEALSQFAVTEGLRQEAIQDRMRAAAQQELGLAEVMLAPDAPVIGMSLRQAEFRKRRGLTVLAVKRRGEVLAGNLIDIPLKFGDLILVAGGWPLIAELQQNPGEFVVLRLPEELRTIAPARAKAPVAVAILAVMTAVMATGLLPNAIAVLLAALAAVGTGCVPAKNAYHSISWSTLVLIAGMLPLATALEATGVTSAMAKGLTELLSGFGPYGMLAALFLITSAIGLFVSNTATAVLLAPIAIGAAQELGVSAHAFAVTVAIASSCAFVTPVSSPVNTLVMEPGRYQFQDFVKVGLPLLFISLVATVILIGFLYHPVTPASM